MRKIIAEKIPDVLVQWQNNVTTKNMSLVKSNEKLPEILFITSFPPRECGIATYSQDLIKALNDKFNNSFKLTVCPLELSNEKFYYQEETRDVLYTDQVGSFKKMAAVINNNVDISMVVIQHEFGFYEKMESAFIDFLKSLEKPVILVFHTVLPTPDAGLKLNVKKIVEHSMAVIVMTHTSSNILQNEYDVQADKITVIAHGTHLVPHIDKQYLKNKYDLQGKLVLSTFGLLGPGKSIETTLRALVKIAAQYPNVIFLIIGKTHPSIVKHEQEKYRNMLESLVVELNLQAHVKFVNRFLPLAELLEYLQLTEIYLFTSKDPNQAVSGTFSYAISSGCPIISTPIPHAREVLQKNTGVIVDFQNPNQLGDAVISLLQDEQLRKSISANALHKMATTAWENAAIAHARLFVKIGKGNITLKYKSPAINLDHIKRLTSSFGIIQFSKLNDPDLASGYTLDDNARAMIALIQHYELKREVQDLVYISIYLKFISFCLNPKGYFLNYVNEKMEFTEQNYQTNLADANGRAIWALGFLISKNGILPEEMIDEAELIIECALKNVPNIHSTRAMAFAIKGIYYLNCKEWSIRNVSLARLLADRLVQMYKHESNNDWQWFESYLTYANSILPEALLCASIITNNSDYKHIAKSTFDFLLSKTFVNEKIRVISNNGWLYKGKEPADSVIGGQQPIDVSYCIQALAKFYDEFDDVSYKHKIQTAFNWFLGSNHLNEIIYNPSTGGCYDGLEDDYINLNQGAESSVSYLMARLTIENEERNLHVARPQSIEIEEYY